MFLTTHGSVVSSAGDATAPESQQALETLCRTYWYPLYAYVRRRGYSPEDAQDLTQEFFARLLARNWVGHADAHKGRFRTFLLTAMSHFLADEWDRLKAQKRGGGQQGLPLVVETAETRFQLEPPDPLTPEKIYERRWAETLLETVFERLRRRLQRDFDPHGRPGSRCAPNLKLTLESFGPFRHAEQAEMAIVGADGTFRGETNAVIRYLQHHLLRAKLQLDLCQVRAGVLDHIGERLLANAQQVFLHHFRQEPRRAFGLQLHSHARAMGHLPRAVGQGAGQVELRERPAAQIPHRTAHLHLAHGHEIARQLEVVQRAIWIALVELRGGVQLQGDARERLFHCIVEFLGQARPFGQHALELKLGFLARRDLKLELRRAASCKTGRKLSKL